MKVIRLAEPFTTIENMVDGQQGGSCGCGNHGGNGAGWDDMCLEIGTTHNGSQ
jgi:hypothetical protein